MTTLTPRLRLFAGPNGSGKSTIKTILAPELLGVYINPDEIQFSLESNRRLDLDLFGVKATTDEWLAFAQQSSLLRAATLSDAVKTNVIAENTLRISSEFGDKAAYVASVLSDFIRRKLLHAVVHL